MTSNVTYSISSQFLLPDSHKFTVHNCICCLNTIHPFHLLSCTFLQLISRDLSISFEEVLSWLFTVPPFQAAWIVNATCRAMELLFLSRCVLMRYTDAPIMEPLITGVASDPGVLALFLADLAGILILNYRLLILRERLEDAGVCCGKSTYVYPFASYTWAY